MKIEIAFHENFRNEVKKFLKKFPALADELRDLEAQLLLNPYLGTPLGAGLYKVRLGGKNKGKSGGFRVINLLVTQEKTDIVVNVISIYDKSEEENIPKSALVKLVKKIGL